MLILSAAAMAVLVAVFLGLKSSSIVQWANRTRADELIGQAGQELSKSDFKGNVNFLKAVADIDPKNPRVWWKLCEGYQFTEQLDLAIAACKRQIEISSDGLSYNSLGLAYQAKKDYSNAVLAFEEAVKRSDEPIINENFAWALLLAQQYDRAIPVLQHLIARESTDRAQRSADLEELGATLMKLGKVNEAKDIFSKVHKLDPGENPKTCELKTDAKYGLSVHCTLSLQPVSPRM